MAIGSKGGRGGPGDRKRQSAVEDSSFHLNQAVNSILFDLNLDLGARDDNVATREDGMETTRGRAKQGGLDSKLDRSSQHQSPSHPRVSEGPAARLRQEGLAGEAARRKTCCPAADFLSTRVELYQDPSDRSNQGWRPSHTQEVPDGDDDRRAYPQRELIREEGGRREFTQQIEGERPFLEFVEPADELTPEVDRCG